MATVVQVLDVAVLFIGCSRLPGLCCRVRPKFEAWDCTLERANVRARGGKETETEIETERKRGKDRKGGRARAKWGGGVYCRQHYSRHEFFKIRGRAEQRSGSTDNSAPRSPRALPPSPTFLYDERYIVQHTDLGGLHKDILGPDGIYTYGGPGISIVASSIVVLITLVQLTGTDALVSANTVFACVSLLPSFIFIIWGLPTINKEFAGTCVCVVRAHARVCVCMCIADHQQRACWSRAQYHHTCMRTDVHTCIVRYGLVRSSTAWYRTALDRTGHLDSVDSTARLMNLLW